MVAHRSKKKTVRKDLLDLAIYAVAGLVVLVFVYQHVFGQTWSEHHHAQQLLQHQRKIMAEKVGDIASIHSVLVEQYRTAHDQMTQHLGGKSTALLRTAPAVLSTRSAAVSPQQALFNKMAVLQSRIGSYEGGYGFRTPFPVPPAVPEDKKTVSTDDASHSTVVSYDGHSPFTDQPILYAGSIIPAVLLTKLTSGFAGLVKAQVAEDVYDSRWQHELMIPKGSVLLGQYSQGVVMGQERILVTMTRLIFPNGAMIQLPSFVATDMQGASGLPAAVDNHFLKIFGSALLIGTIGAVLQPVQPSGIDVSMANSPYVRLGMVGRASSSALDRTVQQILDRNKTIEPTLEVDSGSIFFVMVSKDMVMKAYE